MKTSYLKLICLGLGLSLMINTQAVLAENVRPALQDDKNESAAGGGDTGGGKARPLQTSFRPGTELIEKAIHQSKAALPLVLRAIEMYTRDLWDRNQLEGNDPNDTEEVKRNMRSMREWRQKLFTKVEGDDVYTALQHIQFDIKQDQPCYTIDRETKEKVAVAASTTFVGVNHICISVSELNEDKNVTYDNYQAQVVAILAHEMGHKMGFTNTLDDEKTLEQLQDFIIENLDNQYYRVESAAKESREISLMAQFQDSIATLKFLMNEGEIPAVCLVIGVQSSELFSNWQILRNDITKKGFSELSHESYRALFTAAFVMHSASSFCFSEKYIRKMDKTLAPGQKLPKYFNLKDDADASAKKDVYDIRVRRVGYKNKQHLLQVLNQVENLLKPIEKELKDNGARMPPVEPEHFLPDDLLIYERNL